MMGLAPSHASELYSKPLLIVHRFLIVFWATCDILF
jgi:hypothetical protein